MRCDLPLLASSGCTFDHIAEREVLGDTAETAGTPASKIVLYAPLDRLTKQSPRLPAGSRYDAHPGAFLLSVLGAIATTQRLYDSDNLATLLKPSGNERLVYEVGDDRSSGYENVRTWNEHIVKQRG